MSLFKVSLLPHFEYMWIGTNLGLVSGDEDEAKKIITKQLSYTWSRPLDSWVLHIHSPTFQSQSLWEAYQKIWIEQKWKTSFVWKWKPYANPLMDTIFNSKTHKKHFSYILNHSAPLQYLQSFKKALKKLFRTLLPGYHKCWIITLIQKNW